MRLPKPFIRLLCDRLMHVPATRAPDVIIGGAADPYLRRWWIVPRNRYFNVYLHHFLRSDDDRALHDHPWWNASILLDGRYIEHTIPAGDVKLRGARSAHRVELIDGPCWTLFITGPRLRDWGFHCPHGWRPWQQFVDGKDSGSIGKGCD